MSNLDNLKNWKKGQSGNPKGRPKKIPELDKIMGDLFHDEDRMKGIIESLEKQAKKGNVRAAEVLLDRAYGKAKQSMDITTNGESINIPPKRWADDKQ